MAQQGDKGCGPLLDLGVIEPSSDIIVLRRFARTKRVIDRFKWTPEEFDERNKWEPLFVAPTLKAARAELRAFNYNSQSTSSFPISFYEVVFVRRQMRGVPIRSFDGKEWHEYNKD